MHQYELMVILDPEIDERTVAPSLEKFLGVIRNDGGTIETVDIWGRRRLAYEINKKTEGIYAVVNFTATSAATQELDRQLKLREAVMRTKVLRTEEAVARAAPDGMTLLVGTNSTNAAARALFRNVPFDMENGFVSVSTIATVPLLVAVKADSPYRTLAELLAAARARPMVGGAMIISCMRAPACRINGAISSASGRLRQYFFGISAVIAFTFNRAGLKMDA